jgi:flagellin-like hook-associated protein FlgL
MTGVSALSRLDAGAAMLRARLEKLSQQVADGRKGTYLGDIAPSVGRAIDLRADMTRRAAYQTTISNTQSQTDVAQSTLQRLSDIATRAYSLAQSVSSSNKEGIAAAAQEAKTALAEVAQLLNGQYAGQYIFGGKDSANPPIPDPDNIAQSGMVQQIATAVQGLNAGNAAATSAATLAAAQSDAAGTTPFSAYLSDPARGLTEARRSVPAADGQNVAYGLFANRNAAGASTGDTTGAWSRDLIRGLATLAAMTPDQAALGTGFDAFAQNLRQGLKDTITGIGQEQGALGAVEARLKATATDHADVTIALKTQLSDIEEVDFAETSTRLQATRDQLEASYNAISLASSLTLTQFLR